MTTVKEAGLATIDMKLEVIVIPVSDAERAEQFLDGVELVGAPGGHQREGVGPDVEDLGLEDGRQLGDLTPVGGPTFQRELDG